MQGRTLSLGILAHVDAGKTTLTERLLYAAGAIDELGSVDAGTTLTDWLALERQRGITIKAAVASFVIHGVSINLVDTPGHPDFIAEVDRVLDVLDGAVLVVSAVEGVQPQTRVLARALRRLRTPTVVFVNKIDRAGAANERVLRELSDRLGLVAVPMGTTRSLGTSEAGFSLWSDDAAAARAMLAEVLAERDDAVLAGYVEHEGGVPYRQLRESLAAQTRRAAVTPVFFGSAITGAGVDDLMSGVAELLSATPGDADGPVSARVFKIDRTASGERVAYIRVFSGTVRVRDRVPFGRGLEDRVTAIEVFDDGGLERRSSVTAGHIARIRGLDGIRIGDDIGVVGRRRPDHRFAPPTLEAVVVARDQDDRARLRVALGQLTEQDPLIDVRQDDRSDEIAVSLYGEVQKEVIQATLASDFGVEVTFRGTTTIHVERPVGTGDALERLQDTSNPFSATLGLRVEPAPLGSGVRFDVDVEPRLHPIYIYKSGEHFIAAMNEYVQCTLREGLYGWGVTDCVVTMDQCGYYVGDGRGKPTGSTPRTTAADFRKLTPMVLMRALERAGTVVCGPIVRVTVEMAADALGAVLAEVARLRGSAEAPAVRGDLLVLDASLPAAAAQDLVRRVPGLTGGEGVADTSFVGYEPLSGAPPVRRRTTADPRNRQEYIAQVR